MNGLGNRGWEPSTILRKYFGLIYDTRCVRCLMGPIIKCSVLTEQMRYKMKLRNMLYDLKDQWTSFCLCSFEHFITMMINFHLYCVILPDNGSHKNRLVYLRIVTILTETANFYKKTTAKNCPTNCGFSFWEE